MTIGTVIDENFDYPPPGANQLIDHGNIIYGLHRHQNDGHDPLNSSPAMMSHADDVMNKL